MNRSSVIALNLTLALTLSACGGGSGDDNNNSSAFSSASSVIATSISSQSSLNSSTSSDDTGSNPIPSSASSSSIASSNPPATSSSSESSSTDDQSSAFSSQIIIVHPESSSSSSQANESSSSLPEVSSSSSSPIELSSSSLSSSAVSSSDASASSEATSSSSPKSSSSSSSLVSSSASSSKISSSSFSSSLSSRSSSSVLSLSSSSRSSSSASSIPANAHLVTISNAQNAPGTGLACNQANAPASCDLRMYQIMVESFIDADPNANYNLAYGNSHHKGDLQGIINSLDYIESLGVNTIWLTPVFLSQPNPNQDHWATRLDGTGYFASNYFAVDPKFGTSAQLHELISKAHAKGLYVLLDGVFGHFKSNAKDFPSPNNRTVTQTNGSATYPQDLEFFKEVATYWIKEYKIDGWRLDQAYQVPVGYWDDLRTAVEAASAATTYINKDGQSVNPLGYMVAEIWDGENVITSKGYGTNNTPALKSAFDFPLRYKLVQTLAVEESGGGKTGANNLNLGFNTHLNYPAHAQPNLMLTNHDLVRFGDLLQRGNIANPSDDAYWLRHKAAFSFMTAFSGPITIYYGDEIGEEFPNYAAKVCDAVAGTCDDHVSRTSAKIAGLPPTVGAPITVLNSRQSDLKEYVTEMMELRAANPALSKGRRTHIFSNSNIYIDRKDHADGNMLYIANTNAAPAVITLAGNAIGSQADLVNPRNNDVYIASGGNYTIHLAPFEALFLQIDGVVDPIEEDPADDDSLTGEGALADCARPVVAGTGPLGKDMFIRGNYVGGNNFAATPADRKFAYTGDNIYQVKVNESAVASYSFKFAAANWSSEFAVAGSAPVEIASAQVMATASGAGTESLISIPKAGQYVFSFEINGALNGGNMMVSLCP